MEMDVEVVHRTSGKSRFDAALGVLVGVAAVTAALLATLEMHSSKNWEQASTKGADLSVELFGKIAASGSVNAAGARAQQASLLTRIESTARDGRARNREFQVILGDVDARVSTKLQKLAETVRAVPGPESGVDPVTREVIATQASDLVHVASEQREQVDLSERYGTRISRSVFALSLLALAAILLGLAAVLGVEHGGAITLGAAAVALLAAGAWGGSAMLV